MRSCSVSTSRSEMRLVAPLLLILTVAPAAADPATAVYNHACAWCHGRDGRGDGPAAFSINKYLSPRPCVRSDRKSTRLNSSHLVISYAVFCLKKKKKYIQEYNTYNKNI